MSKLNYHNKIVTPTHTLIEKVAIELAATWYEIGRAQGLTSKHKTAKAYAAANLEKFIPKAVEHLLDMLGPNSNATPEMKEEIYAALQERINDPGLCEVMPNVDVKKALELAEQMERKKPPVELAIDKALKKPEVKKSILENKPLPATRH